MMSPDWKRALVAIVPALLALGCAPGSPTVNGPRETLSQVSTIDAVLNGVYDGVIDFGTLKQFGDFGIGTVEGLDGEVLVLDGTAYQVTGTGKVNILSDATLTPFASVTWFDADRREPLPAAITSFAAFEKFLDSLLPSPNMFYAIRVDGAFSYVKTRSVPAQKKPYPRLVEVTKNQPTFEFTDVSGTIIGFRTPVYVGGVNVPGYHLHFINAERTGGGHLLELKVKDATALVDYTPEFRMVLPDLGNDFHNIDLGKDLSSELNKAEK